MQKFSTSPLEMFAGLWRYRGLVGTMAQRDIVGRYRGSMLGLAWSFFNPVFMLAIYTFVFSGVFNARWGLGPQETKADFAIVLFVGIIVHGLFAECVNRAPGLILSNASYVKKVVFPLEVLPWVALGSAVFHAFASVLVLVVAEIVLRGHVPWTAILFPFVLLPLLFTTMGFAWFLTALGVYVRDIGQLTSVFTTVLMFLSPVFYPASALPPSVQAWLRLNPLTVIIEEGRNALVFGRVPDGYSLVLAFLVSLVVAWAGFAWFQKARTGFADVV